MTPDLTTPSDPQAARDDDLWNDETLFAICAALQDCGITYARLGDNILPNAKRFRDALAAAGLVITAPDAAGRGTVAIDWPTAHMLASLCREHGYPGTADYLDEQIAAATGDDA